jgi:hypothetical protein
MRHLDTLDAELRLPPLLIWNISATGKGKIDT